MRKFQSQTKILRALYEEREFEFMTYKELLKETRLHKLSLSRNLKELCDKDARKIALVEGMKLSKLPKWILTGLSKPPIVMTKNGVYKLRPQVREQFDRIGGVSLITGPLGGKPPRSKSRLRD